MKSGSLLLFTLFVVLFAWSAFSDPARIVIDGDFTDWEDMEPIYSDASGDQASGSIDFGRLWIASDKENLFLSIEVGAEINLQEYNHITLYLDSDDKPGAGFYIREIGRLMGPEIEWTFGMRRGYNGQAYRRRQIYHEDIGLVAAPTVTSARFEMATTIPYSWGRPAKSRRYVDMNLVFSDHDGGDRLPDEDALEFTIRRASPPLLPGTGLERDDDNHIRLLTYNVLNNGLFYTTSGACQRRILQAIRPDIIGFQEIYSYTAEETRDLIASMLPDDPDGSPIPWQASLVEPDIVVVSRYPIVGTFDVGTNGAFLIDLSEDHGKDLFLIVAHLPCCQNNEGRQWEVDEIMAFVRDAREPGGMLDLAEGTPLVIMGDLNLVGYRRQLETLLTGGIVNTETFGPAFAPDWDGTDLADLMPLHTHLPMAYTWYDGNSSYWPGRLDYIIYTDSAAESAEGFVLWTEALPSRMLLDYGLQSGDTYQASDHLPVVCDLIIE